MKKLFFLSALFIFLAESSAQQPEMMDSTKPYPSFSGSYFRVRLEYASDYVYEGRKDSIAAPYLSGSIGYYHRSGFFLRGRVSYLTAQNQQRVDLISATGGYTFYKENYFGGVMAKALFFNDSSYVVQSELDGSFEAYFGYDMQIVEATLDASVLLSDVSDISTGLELSKMIFFGSNIFIEPYVYFTAGTQNFYEAYYNNSSSSTGNYTGNGAGNGNNAKPDYHYQLLESEKFNFTSIEFGLPLNYKWRQLRIYFEPEFITPLNPATIVEDNVQTVEELENSFVWTLGCSYRF